MDASRTTEEFNSSQVTIKTNLYEEFNSNLQWPTVTNLQRPMSRKKKSPEITTFKKGHVSKTGIPVHIEPKTGTY